MNLREGRSGTSESVFSLSLAMTICGLFIISSEQAYAGGNSTYISVPLGCLLAFFVYAACAWAQIKTGSGDLSELFTYAFGRVASSVISVVICAIQVLFISIIMDRFLNLMQAFFFHDASIYALAGYFFAVTTVLACMGFEVQNRTAKLTAILFLLVHILLLFNSRSGYESYKIYPVVGDGSEHMLLFSLQSVILFLPSLTVLLSCSGGVNGSASGMRISLRATTVTTIICAVTQLFLALSATYDELAEFFMPLYRMSMVTGEENFLVRLDKVSAFIWTLGALSACAYLLYGASHLFCRTFSQDDIRPGAVSFGLVGSLLCLLNNSDIHILDHINKPNLLYTLVLSIPLLSAAAAALIKHSVSHRKRRTI